MPITAIKNGITRKFTDDQWNRMPKDKFGWTLAEGAVSNNSAPIPEELVQKKMVGGATVKDVKPSEIVTTNEDVPEELISKPIKKIVTKPIKKDKK